MATEEACLENEHINEGVCEKDTLEQCGSPDTNCTRLKGWKKGLCAEGQCVATDCKDGYVIKNGKCTAVTPTVECADNEHVYENKCEKDTLDHCGSHDNNCAETEGWGSGVCNHGECVVTSCAANYVLKGSKCSEDNAEPTTTECDEGWHEYNSECEKDTIENCGTHGNNCTIIEGWKSGACLDRACFITECQEGYTISDGRCTNSTVPQTPELECGEGTHEYENECEENTTENCGTHGNNCAVIDGWLEGVCTNGKCVATACQEKYNLNVDRCEAITSLECTANQHVYNDNCEDDSIENCGAHSMTCTNMTGWLTGSCDNKMCVPTQCNSGFCIDPNSHICVNGASNINACGTNGGNCLACPAGQQCTEGQCVTPPPECTATQHLYENGCEDDTEENCGTHGNKCQIAGASGHKCEQKQCMITGCSGGYYSNGNACYPNDDNNCGMYGKKCNSNTVTNSETAACNKSTGNCYAKTCTSNYHVHQGICEQDTNENCGAHGVSCDTSNYPNSLKVMCQSKSCKVITCKAGLEVSDNKCVGQNGCPVGSPYYCSGSCCKNASCSGACIMAL